MVSYERMQYNVKGAYSLCIGLFFVQNMKSKLEYWPIPVLTENYS